MSNENEDPKIIVDDDWKTQVEKEKEQLKKEIETSPDSAAEPVGSQEVPPASFSILISTIATQAMGSLGILPDPTTGQPNANLDLAKHFIDTLGVLQEKTKGNLDADETAMLRDALHQLRMIYVSADAESKKAPEPAEESPASKLELPE